MNTMISQKINLFKIHLKAYVEKLEGTHTILVSPEVAKEWLGMNNNNRPVSEKHILNLANRMDKGEWMLNGQGIIFSYTGNLLDGQHRLMAVVKHGEPVLFDVVFGVSNEAFTTLDDGKKRSPSDVFDINGIPNATNMAASVKKAIRLKRGDKQSNGKLHGSNELSNLDSLNWYLSNPEIKESFTLAMKWYDISGKILSVSEFAAFHFVMSEVNKDDANEFMSKLAIGSNLSSKSPIFRLRALLIQSKINKLRKLQNSVKNALIIKAWNFFRGGREIKILRFDSEREDFPVLK